MTNNDINPSPIRLAITTEPLTPGQFASILYVTGLVTPSSVVARFLLAGQPPFCGVRRPVWATGGAPGEIPVCTYKMEREVVDSVQIGIRPLPRGSFPTALEIESLFGAPAKGRACILFEDAEHTDAWLCVGTGLYWRVGPMGLWAARLERA